jgi:hypothetical protein
VDEFGEPAEILGEGTLVVGFEQQTEGGASLYDRANNKRIEHKSHDPVNSELYRDESVYRLASPASGALGEEDRAFERGAFTDGTRSSMSGNVAFTQDWDLDGLGNWARQDDDGRVETRDSSDFNEIYDRTTGGETTGLTHDKNGNTTGTGAKTVSGQNFPGGGLRLRWDALNRLREVYDNKNTSGSEGDDTLEAVYSYDCMNRRFRKVVTNGGIPDDSGLNGTTDFYYEGWRVFEERDGDDDVLRQFVYGNYLDEVWVMDDRSGGQTIADLNDESGSDRHFYHQNTLYHVYKFRHEPKESLDELHKSPQLKGYILSTMKQYRYMYWLDICVKCPEKFRRELKPLLSATHALRYMHLFAGGKRRCDGTISLM